MDICRGGPNGQDPIISQSVKGNSPAQATMKMSQHYRLGLHFVFKDHELRRA